MPRIEVLYFEGCPHAEPAIALVEEVVASLAPGEPVHRVRVESAEAAGRERFAGSPSVRINGRDLEDRAPADAGLGCRLYAGGEGVPPRWLVEAGLLRALSPRHVLFLCVANSARSQLAEGLARGLAPAGIKISSAGSAPTSVRPEAIAVLRELGLDPSGQRSKAIGEIDASDVDAVITLCAEEVCPLYLGKAHRLHWGLADPARAEGSGEARLEAFRQTRDELQRRLERLFGTPGPRGVD